MKKYNMLMLVGVPGSGKSTLADDNQLIINGKYGVDTLLSSDNIIQDAADNLGKTYSGVFNDVIKAATDFVETMIYLVSYSKQNFIIDSTNLTVKSRARKLNLMQNKAEYNKIAIVFPTPDVEELRKRLDGREGKIINPTLAKEMQDKFVYPTLEEGFDMIYTAEEFLKSLDVAQRFGEAKFA